MLAWLRAHYPIAVFGLLFLLAGSLAIWLWETGQLTTNTGEKTTLEVEVNALKALHEENNRLQAELVGLKEELVAMSAQVTETNAKIAGARTEAAPSTVAVASGAASSISASSPATPTTSKVNINTADLAQLETLPGIGPSKAQAIIDHRTANGPFKTPNELTNVKGIGEKTYESLASLITVD